MECLFTLKGKVGNLSLKEQKKLIKIEDLAETQSFSFTVMEPPAKK
ncbi:hypothetical protein GAMM_250074 [Gammaproteobacteria bacterium]